MLLGPNISIGKGTIISDFAVIYDGVTIGENCFVGPGAVLGGLSFAWQGDFPNLTPAQHNGKLVIGNSVYIGAQTIIDRGTDRDTMIEDHAKIDAQCRIGHDAYVGEHSIMVGQSGIAGWGVLGPFCRMYSQSMIADKSGVDAWCVIGAHSVVKKVWPERTTLLGCPAKPFVEELRHVATAEHGEGCTWTVGSSDADRSDPRLADSASEEHHQEDENGRSAYRRLLSWFRKVFSLD